MTPDRLEEAKKIYFCPAYETELVRWIIAEVERLRVESAERKPGHSRLVYNKQSKTIEKVTDTGLVLHD